VLLLGPLGGVIADRFDNRRILFATQAAAACLAIVPGSLVATGVIAVRMVSALAACHGLVLVVDTPHARPSCTTWSGDNRNPQVSDLGVLS
jgi:nitrate/nitrite transporter NarK